MRVCGSGDVRRRRLPCRLGKAAYWRAALPLGHATTFAAARWRRAHRVPRRGTSSCRYRCRSRPSRYWVSETWRAPCLWRPSWQIRLLAGQEHGRTIPLTEMDAVRRRQWVSPSGLHFGEGPIPEGTHPLPRSGIIETREGLFLLVPSTRHRFACKRYTHSIGAIRGNSICRKQLRSWLAAWSPQPFPSVPKHGAFADKAFTMALMVLACATVCRLAWS